MPSTPADAVRELYDRLPWPPPSGVPGRGNTLSTSWLTAATHPRPQPLSPGHRVLVAGCGRGDEAVGLAQACPDLDVVGVDVSERSIDLARARQPTLAAGSRLELARVDLVDGDAMAALGTFDLVICHAVADYVPDSGALLANLAAASSPAGVVFLSVNTPDHPAARVRRTFEALGVPPVRLQGSGPAVSEAQRQALAAAAALMGPDSGLPELADLPGEVLAVDIFPPFAHHRTVDAWADLAAAAGLHLVGAQVLPHALADVPDAALGAVARLPLPSLVRLTSAARRWPSANLLLGHAPPPQPPWTEPTALAAWVPSRDSGLPAEALPAWSPDQAPADAAIPLTVRITGQPDAGVATTAAALEVMRRMDGATGLGDLARAARVPLDAVWRPLFRAWIADLVHLVPPAR